MRDMNRTSKTEPRDPFLEGWECLCNPTWTEMVDDGMMPPDSTMMTSWRVFFFVLIFYLPFWSLLHCQEELTGSTAFSGMHFWQSSKHAVDSLLHD